MKSWLEQRYSGSQVRLILLLFDDWALYMVTLQVFSLRILVDIEKKNIVPLNPTDVRHSPQGATSPVLRCNLKV
jgi:hypothetical protein